MKKLLSIIFLLYISFSSIHPKNIYSVNFQWINKSLNVNQKYIYPAYNRTDLVDNFLGNISQWAYLNKYATINIWFDSKFTTVNAIKATQSIIGDYISNHRKIASIYLRDIRVFDEVKNNPEVFSDEIPVYFRVDLLRAIESLYSIYDNITCFVHADLDMKPLSKRALFDNETKEKLSEYGIVMAESTRLGYENGFMIISNHKPNLHKAMKWILIDLNIERAHEALKGHIIKNGCRHDINGIQRLQDVVYGSFRSMFKYFLHLEEKARLTFDWPEDTPFDREKWGYKMYGLHLYHNGEYSDYRDHTRISEDIAAPSIPTKKVGIPNSTSILDDNCRTIYH